ncbi:MAG: Rrf2 family transcriptional regulator [Clostridiales bacterium]|nr:Rrf2 family transcriptional regulator [Clostridiales bacterium]
MKISTRGRYALRMMIEFGMNPDGCTKISQVAERLGVSDKYLEQIVSLLHKAGYVRSTRGAQGGYTLTRDPGEYTVGMILRVTEGSLSPVACLDTDEEGICDKKVCCSTLSLWQQMKDAIDEVVDHMTLADLIEEQKKKPDEALM